MPRYFLISVLLLTLVFAASALAADKPSGDNKTARGGLVCFSITPPKEGGPSCDALCAAKDAVCVGLKMNGALNPGFGCGDALDPLKGSNAAAGCRCCAVAH